MRNVNVGWALAVASAVVGACTSSTSSIDIAELPAKLVEERCESLVRCGTYPDQATCEGAMDTTTVPLAAAVNAGTVKYDGQSASTCVQAVERDTALCLLSQQGRTTLPPACANMFMGTVANGGPCLHDQECVSATCDRSACADACCAGACVASAVLTSATPAGTACASNADCVAGTFCSTNDAVAVCTPLLGEGQSCHVTEECAMGTACIMTPSSNGALVCADPPKTGQACAGPGVCDSPKDFCDPASLTCQPRLAVGATCDPGADGCVAYAFCGAGGTCLARGAVGAACAAPPAASTCLGGLSCAGGVCALPAAPPACPTP